MRALDIPAKAAHQRHTIKKEPMRKRGFFRFGLSVIPHFPFLTATMIKLSLPSYLRPITYFHVVNVECSAAVWKCVVIR